MRLRSFWEMVNELGLSVPQEYLACCEYTHPSQVYKATGDMLALADPPTCIMVCDDYSATGAFRAASEAGLRVPDDISLAGFDGIEQMQSFHPRLTTVYQDSPRIGREAARQLITLVEGGEPVMASSVPSRLIRGETVKQINP